MGKNRNRQVNIRLSDEEYGILENLAHKNGYNSISEYVRSVAVYQYPGMMDNLKLIPEISKKLGKISDKLQL